MVTALPERRMAKKKAVPTVQVRVAQDVAQLAAIVAAYRDIASSDLLNEILRPVLQKMHAQEVAKAGRPKGDS
jgi:hypothetical protein